MTVPPEHFSRQFEGSLKEQNQQFRHEFTPAERETLKKYGASIYTLTGQTLSEQEESRKQQGMPSVWYLPEYPNYVLDDETPSWRGQVAIFLKADRHFIEGSFGQTRARQRITVADDANLLREMLNLPNITEIIPNVPTVTEIARLYHEETGKWLFEEYARYRNLGKVYTRTNTQDPNYPWFSAIVGIVPPNHGVYVNPWWNCNFLSPYVGVMRLVVPVEPR